jgi:signal transduction histidine kinase
VAISVAAPNGAFLYRSQQQHQSSLTAQDSLGPRFGNLVARATLHPAFAEAIVIKGPPRGQLPLLAGIFAVTMGLMTAALFQLRRESELARLRSDFVSSVSHELRTPLAQIRLFAETLLLGRVRSENEARRSLEIIDQEVRRLTHLVENVLHFSRAERRTIHLSLETVELGILVQEIAESFAPLASAHQMVMSLEVESGVMALVDPGAVRQMVINLLDNAVKYGSSGQTIKVGLRWIEEPRAAAEQRAEPHEGRARVFVDDRGPGIHLRDRKRIWERFTRLGRDGSAVVAGTGIGLAIVRELAELHGGGAWVEDAPGGGARFVVELPGAWRKQAVAGGVEGAPGGPPTPGAGR